MSFTARTTASRSRVGVARQKRWRTARPVDGERGLRRSSGPVGVTTEGRSAFATSVGNERGAPLRAPLDLRFVAPVGPVGPMGGWNGDGLEVVHSAAGHGRTGVLLGLVHDDRLGGEEESGDG